MRRQRNGFTLIELIASVMLAAMMMAALMNITWSVFQEMRRMKAAEASRFPITILADQMRRDLLNARGIQVDPSGITLHGYLDRDAKTDQPSLLPGRVQYQVVDSRRSRQLVRRVVGESKTQSELVWQGVGKIEFESMMELEKGDVIVGSETGGLPPAPGRFRVTMTGADGQVLWREVIHHHAS